MTGPLYVIGVVMLCTFCALLVTAAICMLVDSFIEKADIYRERRTKGWR